jgi:hypothetical protein
MSELYLPPSRARDILCAAALLYDLEALSRDNSISRYFAQLYYETTRSIGQQLRYADQQTVELTLRFQQRFAAYFLECRDHAHPGSAEWGSYYSTTALQPVQYALLGINAHINGDMWQALVDCFNEKELEDYERRLLDFQQAIRKVYTSFYRCATEENMMFRGLHIITAGLSKKAGEYYLYHCRLQQVKLALLYYRDRARFRKKLSRLKLHKRIVDRCIHLFL